METKEGKATHRCEIDWNDPRVGDMEPQRSEQGWECPECKMRYTRDVGNCGNNLDCSKPQVIPQQPQRSEQQKWTVERIASYIGTKPYQQFADDINAALEAERQRREQEWTDDYVRELYSNSVHGVVAAHKAALAAAYKDRDDWKRKAWSEIQYLEKQLAAERAETEAWKRNGENAVAGLERELEAEREISKEWFDKWGEVNGQLEAERQRREQVEQLSNQLYVALRAGKPIPLGFRLCDEVQYLLNKNERLSERLLSAQAAIEQARNTVYAERRDEILNNVNISALDQHDSETRKPLVDALVKAKFAMEFERWHWDGALSSDLKREARQTVADALAKVKHETNESK